MSREGRASSAGLGLRAGEEEGGEVMGLMKWAGARALVGLEFFYRPVNELWRRRVRLDKVNANGESFKGTDVNADVGLVGDISPRDLTVGVGTRRRNEPVIRLLEECDLPFRQFVDPLLERAGGDDAEFLTPNSAFEPFRWARGRQGPRAGLQGYGEEQYQEFGGGRNRIPLGGRGLPVHRGVQSPAPLMGGRGFGFGAERAPGLGYPGRGATQIPFAPQVQQAGYFAGTPNLPEHQPIPQHRFRIPISSKAQHHSSLAMGAQRIRGNTSGQREERDRGE
jgi:hypothetical protein